MNHIYFIANDNGAGLAARLAKRGGVYMAELKTKELDGDVFEFIITFANTEQKREDSLELVKLMQKVTEHPPKMWGPSMIGFGRYHYKSNRSKPT